MVKLRTLLKLTVLGAVGAGLVPVAGAEVLAEVAGRVITVETFTAEMARRGGDARFADAEARRVLLDELVEQELLLAAAMEAGYDRDPEAVAVFERMVAARYQADALGALLDSVTVDDSEVLAHYQDHVDRYARPSRSKAAVIFFEVPPMASEKHRSEVRARAERVRAEALELDGVSHFGALATQHSDDRSSRYRGGVIGWLVEHPGRAYRWDPALVEAVFALDEEGAIAPLIGTDDGYYLVRLVEREGATPQPFERVRDGIRRQLVQVERDRIREAFYADLRTRLAVAVDQGLFDTIDAPPSVGGPGQGPPPMPAS